MKGTNNKLITIMSKPSANVFIQYKGTDICMDFNCSCGAELHFDGYFAYNVTCGRCGTTFHMQQNFTINESTKEQVDKMPTVLIEDE